ncbi:hypothetical protein TcasGA2_TC009523 [Tribolium castaneum]|uniref:Uncharacterized protein n=1 Tax=Tribolium castaneum TaxID=7070 RepID=D6WS06_TRICA|nr:hypothetical protein TcasGA2_TC009523 [Tribolium castaneum]
MQVVRFRPKQLQWMLSAIIRSDADKAITDSFAFFRFRVQSRDDDDKTVNLAAIIKRKDFF